MIPRAKNADPVLESHLISHKKRIFFYCFFKLEWNGSCFFSQAPIRWWDHHLTSHCLTNF